ATRALREYLLDLLEMLALCLRDEPEAEEEREHADRGVEEERAAAAEAVDQEQEGERDEEVEEPVRHRADRCRLAADPKRIDLRVEQPEDRAEADGERTDVEHQAADGDERAGRPAGAESEDEREDAERDRHQQAPPEQERPAADAVEEADRDEGHADVDDAD